ncbi:MAG: ASKHA domain-containing protein [Christensenellales bacterium]
MAYELKVINGKHIQNALFADGGNILRILSNHGIMLSSPCGGNGRCGKCKVKVSGNVSGVTEQEQSLLTRAELESGIRLACCCFLLGNARVEIEESPAEILLGCYGPIDLYPSLEVMALRCEGAHLGVAVDIGTTTLAAYLLDLESGKVLARSPMLNPQRAFGADVISRAQYTMEHQNGLRELSLLIREAVSNLIEQCCMIAQRKVAQVVHVMVAGNTIMLHLLCGESVAGIAKAPYTPVFLDHRQYSAEALGIHAHTACIVSLIGCVSGYVGADIVAGVYNSMLYQKEGINLFLDIGTNGEIVAGGKERMASCSTAAGPAFEGGNIRFGMGGVEGAINSVSWANGSFSCRVIGGTAAKGICGSGLLDIIAVMLDTGIIDATGRMNGSHPRCCQFENTDAVQVAHGVFVTQKDVRQVQLAKAAIAAGIEVLLCALEAKHEDVSQLYLAGGFGSSLNPYSACRIGIFDVLWQDRIVSLGNASGCGALQALSNDKAFEEMKILRRNIEYIELSTNKQFSNLFFENIQFSSFLAEQHEENK